VCKREGGPAAVMCCGLNTPAEGLHTQVWEVEAAKGESFEQTLFSFSITISVIMWTFEGRNSLFYEQTLFTSRKWQKWCESACSKALEALRS
jgi:hypothetical protein